VREKGRGEGKQGGTWWRTSRASRAAAPPLVSDLRLSWCLATMPTTRSSHPCPRQERPGRDPT
jgi:hypothetical protein